MNRVIAAVIALVCMFALLAISRSLQAINHQLTMMSCLYQAENGILCREARDVPKPPETIPYV